MRRRNTGYQDGMWQVPAGHVEIGELPSQAMVREAMEELDIIVSSSDLEFAGMSARPMHDKTGNRIDIFFLAKKWTGAPFIAEPKKCDALRWVSLGDLPRNTTPHVREGILGAYAGTTFSEYDLAWIKKHKVYGIK